MGVCKDKWKMNRIARLVDEIQFSKRACFNWDIGRELYTAPFIWIPAERVNIQKKEREQKFFTYDRFHVWSINYDEEGKINAVMIVNQKNEIIYSMDARILDIDINKTGEKQETGKTVKKAEGKVENMAKQIPICNYNKYRKGRYILFLKDPKSFQVWKNDL